MTKKQWISGIILLTIFGGILIDIYLRNKIINKKLSECSIYTVAKINRIYMLRGMARAKYTYKIDSDIIKIDKGVNDYDIIESRPAYMEKLRKRRGFLLQVSCADKTVHRLLWNVTVPDTLRFIPADGWKDIPFTTPY